MAAKDGEKANAAQANVAEVVDAVGVEQLAELLRAAGYRVTRAEHNGFVQLMSASQGVGFAVRFGNAAAGGVAGAADDAPDGARYLDYTLSCALQVQGELPAELVASWNRGKRFARLSGQGPFLVLELDVIVAGGVTQRHLVSTIELWDRLVQEFLLHLRNRPDLAARELPGKAASQPGQNGPATLQ